MTELWTSADLLEATGGRFTAPFSASGVSIDTRTIEPGDLFVALLGENGDGHEHAWRAMEAGAAGVMSHRRVPGIAQSLIVDDTLAGLARLGAFARARFRGRMVAVTGSVGKTTTKEMLRVALGAFGPVHAAASSHNNHWGVPLTLARIPEGTVSCVVEIGMNHAGEIAPLARLAKPDVAVITSVEAAHIGYLGGLEAIAEEKATIVHGLASDGVAVLPTDSPWFPLLRERAKPRRVLGFGSAPRAAARLTGIEPYATTYSNLLVEIDGRETRVRLNAPGRHMAMNALAALCAVAALGFDPMVAARAMERFTPLPGRGAHRRLSLPDKSAGGDPSAATALLLDESYNANGASMRAALQVMRLQPASRRIAVLGDMLELGEAGRGEHEALADDVAGSADRVFTCGPLMRHLFDALPTDIQGAHADDSATLAPIVAAQIAAGDVILVKGSLGSHMKLIVEAVDGMTRVAPSGGRVEASPSGARADASPSGARAGVAPSGARVDASPSGARATATPTETETQIVHGEPAAAACVRRENGQ